MFTLGEICLSEPLQIGELAVELVLKLVLKLNEIFAFNVDFHLSGFKILDLVQWHVYVKHIRQARN